MSAAKAFVTRFRVGGFEAEVSIPVIAEGVVLNAHVEWTPRVPRMDVEFNAAERAKYQRLLAEAISRAA